MYREFWEDELSYIIYIPVPSWQSQISLSLSLSCAIPYGLLNILPLICQIFELHKNKHGPVSSSAAFYSYFNFDLCAASALPRLATTRTELNVWLCHAEPQKANKLAKCSCSWGRLIFWAGQAAAADETWLSAGLLHRDLNSCCEMLHARHVAWW